MHGNKTQNQRNRALAQFSAGDVDTLVATDVAARGIDVDDITHVINFDAPGDRDAYVHRVGRTARAGRDGVGITLRDRRPGRRDAQDRPRPRARRAEYDHSRPAHVSSRSATPRSSQQRNGRGSRGGGRRRRH